MEQAGEQKPVGRRERRLGRLALHLRG
jgi:hypothetical protein